MATHVFTSIDRFPAGTSIGAYLAEDVPPTLQGKPLGPVVNSQTMSANGTLTFTGLADGVEYYAAAQISGTWRYEAFTTPAAISDPELSLHAVDTTTHGVDMANVPSATQKAALAAAVDAGGIGTNNPPTDLNPYATKDYVTAAIAAIPRQSVDLSPVNRWEGQVAKFAGPLWLTDIESVQLTAGAFTTFLRDHCEVADSIDGFYINVVTAGTDITVKATVLDRDGKVILTNNNTGIMNVTGPRFLSLGGILNRLPDQDYFFCFTYDYTSGTRAFVDCRNFNRDVLPAFFGTNYPEIMAGFKATATIPAVGSVLTSPSTTQYIPQLWLHKSGAATPANPAGDTAGGYFPDSDHVDPLPTTILIAPQNADSGGQDGWVSLHKKLITSLTYQGQTYSFTPTFALGAYGKAIYFANASTPRQNLQGKINYSPTAYYEVTGTYEVPIPQDAKPTKGTDHHMTIIDTTVTPHRVIDLFGVEMANGVITRCGSCSVAIRTGVGSDMGAGSGVVPNPLNGKVNAGPTAANFSSAFGMITPEEMAYALANGNIAVPHPLIYNIQCIGGNQLFPAGPGAHNAPINALPGAVPEGARMFLSSTDTVGAGQTTAVRMPDATIDALAITAHEKVIAKTLSKYGAFLGDHSGQPEIVAEVATVDIGWRKVNSWAATIGAAALDSNGNQRDDIPFSAAFPLAYMKVQKYNLRDLANGGAWAGVPTS